MNSSRKTTLVLIGCVLGLAWGSAAAMAREFEFTLRSQKLAGAAGGYTPYTVAEAWQEQETALIVCDVWDKHHCLNAVRRLEEFAPRLNEVLKAARQRGATIIHAPSDCMPAYENHPARQRAVAAPRAEKRPPKVEFWCSRIPKEEAAAYPLDQSDGGEDDDPAEHAAWAKQLSDLGRNPGMPWKTQSPLIEIDGDRDFISDRGDEVWNVLESRKIKNVVLVGVHLNMCVLGRPFGLRQMVRGGKRTVLMRDMTDCMYNPARWPYVDHFTGNDRMISYVERFVCPTISSDQLLGGEEFRSKYDQRSERDGSSLASKKPPEWVVIGLNKKSDLVVPGAENYRGAQWMRCVVRIPSDWANDDRLRLRLESPAKAKIWLNGKEPVSWETAGAGKMSYRFAPESVTKDDANLLVLRMEFPGGKPTVPAPPVVISGEKKLELKGKWQMRWGDDPSWSNIPLPAKFGGSAEIFYEPE